jgi:NADPH:quinone reductase-like Zn-dependent oxidoreductase
LPGTSAAGSSLGAAGGVLDTGADWSREVRALTGKRGVDVCIDSIGKAVHQSCIRSLARGGVFVTCGATSGPDAVTDLTRVFWNQLTIVGSTMGDMGELGAVMALHRAGGVSPVIDSVIEARNGRLGYQRLEAGDQFGKIVFRWS